ncbi:MAG: RNA 2'-phosphotransferase [Gammaproteobacteria bacterium]|nr:RNA 2'-phosphotransferase [Gammaproteobacteria bacterium]
MNQRLVKTSKFLSYVLRHKPHEIGLDLDGQGWASIDELINAAMKHGTKLDYELIKEVVATNDKKRFALSEDGKKIRANQGHSIKIELGLEAIVPPQFLFHGTATRFMKMIKQQGLKPCGRHHVHLSADYKTAIKVGMRHGIPVVLRIEAEQMYSDGAKFYVSENGVWLTDRVEPKYFSIVAGQSDVQDESGPK